MRDLKIALRKKRKKRKVMTNHCMRGPQHLHIFANTCCFVNYNKAEAVRTDVEGSVGIFTRNGYIKQAVGDAVIQSERGLFKAFQVWGGAFISSENDNKSFVVTTVQKCGLCITYQFMVSVRVKVHEKQSLFSFSLVNIKL